MHERDLSVDLRGGHVADDDRDLLGCGVASELVDHRRREFDVTPSTVPGVATHAATLPAPPGQVWPWLTQLGWHLGGWYTPRWVDRLLFPGNWPSAERLDPALVRDLEPGDTIPDGPPGTAHFVVERAVAPSVLVLHSRTHLPAGWADRLGADLDWVWTFSLKPEGAGTRLLIRNRGWVTPRWLDLAYHALIVPADHIMAQSMLKGLRSRVAR